MYLEQVAKATPAKKESSEDSSDDSDEDEAPTKPADASKKRKADSSDDDEDDSDEVKAPTNKKANFDKSENGDEEVNIFHTFSTTILQLIYNKE